MSMSKNVTIVSDAQIEPCGLHIRQYMREGKGKGSKSWYTELVYLAGGSNTSFNFCTYVQSCLWEEKTADLARWIHTAQY